MDIVKDIKEILIKIENVVDANKIKDLKKLIKKDRVNQINDISSFFLNILSYINIF